MPAEAAPIGSRWYAWKHHWEVVAEGKRDGEPAVYVRRVNRGDKPTRKRVAVPFLVRLLVKHGHRTNTDRND